jgi:hypothetical protein|tara:strand:- start:387 stop:665 length:279 start_codon:yes stop_codon:yes gene_type:complete
LFRHSLYAATNEALASLRSHAIDTLKALARALDPSAPDVRKSQKRQQLALVTRTSTVCLCNDGKGLLDVQSMNAVAQDTETSSSKSYLTLHE